MAAPRPYAVRDGRVVPQFLTAHDYPWLSDVLEAYGRFVGEPRRAWDAYWEQAPLPHAPAARLGAALAVIDRLAPDRPLSRLPARRAREVVFAARAARAGPREAVLGRVALEAGLSVADLEASLFADLRRERRLAPLPATVSAAGLVPATNLAIVQKLMLRALRVRVRLGERAHPVVRFARWRGLICTVLARDATEPVLEISGPLAVLRRTTLYGRALADLVPALPWSGRYRLRAECLLGERTALFDLAHGDVVLPGAEPRRYDSDVEAAFARDLGRLARDWELVREPEPVPAAGTLVFPDFALRHRFIPGRSWLVEIVGFWTPEYLERKLARLRVADVPNLLLCVDENLSCGAEQFPAGSKIVRFRRRIDVRDVLTVVEGHAATG